MMAGWELILMTYMCKKLLTFQTCHLLRLRNKFNGFYPGFCSHDLVKVYAHRKKQKKNLSFFSKSNRVWTQKENKFAWWEKVSKYTMFKFHRLNETICFCVKVWQYTGLQSDSILFFSLMKNKRLSSFFSFAVFPSEVNDFYDKNCNWDGYNHKNV